MRLRLDGGTDLAGSVLDRGLECVPIRTHGLNHGGTRCNHVLDRLLLARRYRSHLGAPGGGTRGNRRKVRRDAFGGGPQVGAALVAEAVDRLDRSCGGVDIALELGCLLEDNKAKSDNLIFLQQQLSSYQVDHLQVCL